MLPFPGEFTETTDTTTETETSAPADTAAAETVTDVLAELSDDERTALVDALHAAGYELVPVTPETQQAPAVEPSAEPAQPAAPPADDAPAPAQETPAPASDVPPVSTGA